MKRFVFLALLLATPAAAEINMADSIEWQTIDSDAVVRGFVSAMSKTMIDKDDWYDVTVTISETIRGGVKQSLHFGTRDQARAEKWRKDKTDLLLFLDNGKELVADDKNFAKFPFGLRRQNGSTNNPIELGKSEAYTAAFGVLTKDTDVLAAARTAARSTATKSHRVDVPWDTPAMKSLYGGSVVWMELPVDAALEKLAIGWITDKSLTTREEGARALAEFRSPENIARMKKLLADKDFAEVTSSNAPKMKRYLVRIAAHEALDAWHVPHTRPLLEEVAK